jgi:opacity protein-like surface antigen
MFSFRRFSLLLAFSLPAIHVVLAQAPAQSSSSTSNPAAQADAPQPSVSVQARIRARREQRRAAAIHDAYGHLYEAFVGIGYQRFTPGASLQRVNLYSWDVGFSRYFNERLGVTLDGRGNYGTAYVGLNQYSVTNPAISHYDVLVGPTYRFYLQPKVSISGRAMVGLAQGNFSGDTNGFSGTALGLYQDGSTFAASVGLPVEYNVTPNVALRVTPEYFATGFGSTVENSLGFTTGVVYRFKKQ